MSKRLILHPLAISAYPAISLFATNEGSLEPSEIVVPLAASFVFASLVWTILTFLVRDAQRAALTTTLTVMIVFMYGPIYHYAASLLPPSQADTFLLSAAAGLLVLGGRFFLKAPRPMTRLTRLANFCTFVLLGIAILKAAVSLPSSTMTFTATVPASRSHDCPGSGHPSIYYIVLDGYAREDVINDLYGGDTSEFLDYLSSRGFYVASKSISNYAQTELSLASSLNFSYLEDLVADFDRGATDRRLLAEMIQNSRMFQLARTHGYKTVAFPTGLVSTEIRTADFYEAKLGYLNPFQDALLNMTPVPAALAKAGLYYQYDSHRDRVLSTIQQLHHLPDDEGPQFVFAHILTPHPPFVFGGTGEGVNPERRFSIKDETSFLSLEGATPEEYRHGYGLQLKFITDSMRAVIDRILSKSRRKPIIILQGDHGPGLRVDLASDDVSRSCLKERFAILNAYHLPGGGEQELYPEISPVNSFRVVLNHYFAGDYKLLKDEAWFSTWRLPYNFVRVTEQILSAREPRCKTQTPCY